ncbi:hypothetical protein GRJ2_001378400 [Grus japonensis]|uniref:Integrase catalytic domain-containing protein n=1 Tax=Grus japonensis TaxID=30415 RepID=A0ABC9WUK6_GRUJA
MPSSYEGVEPICISGVTGGSQQLTLQETAVSLTGNDWEKHPFMMGPEAPCILAIDYLQRGDFKDSKEYYWVFGIAALETKEIEPLSSLPGLLEDPSVVGLLRVKEQQVPIATTMVHWQQYHANRDSLILIHKLISQLESQGVISRTHSPFNSPIWPVWKYNGEWRLTVDYRGLNEVTPPMSTSMPNMLELQYELESKAAKWSSINVKRAAIKQAKWVKPLWYGGRWLKYKYGEAWQIDYITLPQSRQGKRYDLTMVEATTGWLETYPVPHATARNTILGLEKQVLWRHGTPGRIESDNGTHFRNNLTDTWAKEHGIEWVYHIPYHAPASGKIERYNGLLKTTLRAMGGGTLKHWDTHLAKATWLVNSRGSTNRAGPAQYKLPHTVEGDKVPVVCMKNMLGKVVWVIFASGKGKPICRIAFAQGPGCTWWVMQKDGEVWCIPQGDLILGENSQ